MPGATLARHLSTIGTLPEEDGRVLASIRGEIRTVRRTDDILKIGEHPTSVIIVLSGLLCRYSIAPGGGRQIHSFYIPTDAPCLETLYLDYMDHNLSALVDSTIGIVPHETLYEIIDTRPAARKLMWRETLVQAAVFREWLLRNSRMPSVEAMAHLFCEIFTRAQAAGVADGVECDLPLTQEQLGDALGMTAVHANRTLKALREAGAADMRRGKLRIHDWDLLTEIAQYDPQYLHLHHVAEVERRAGGVRG